MMKNINWMISLIWLAGVGFPGRAIAHGANITYQTTAAIKINATYDSGQPMSNAQVSIYSPDEPGNSWLTGTTDETGQFIFIPDPNKLGNWEIKVRQAGHGNIISIPWGENQTTANLNQPVYSQNYTPMQKALMIVSVGWGFVGTALFFYRKPLKHQH